MTYESVLLDSYQHSLQIPKNWCMISGSQFVNVVKVIFLRYFPPVILFSLSPFLYRQLGCFELPASGQRHTLVDHWNMAFSWLGFPKSLAPFHGRRGPERPPSEGIEKFHGWEQNWVEGRLLSRLEFIQSWERLLDRLKGRNSGTN